MNSTQRTLLCSLLLLSAGIFGRCPHATAGNAGRRVVRVADYGLQPGTRSGSLRDATTSFPTRSDRMPGNPPRRWISNGCGTSKSTGRAATGSSTD